MKNLLIVNALMACLMGPLSAAAQPELPYQSIPEVPQSFTPATTVARLIDGLGFRYYWATEGLRSDDLIFRPSEEARTTDETLTHILSLCFNASKVIGIEAKVVDLNELDFEAKRKLTLETLMAASTLLKKNPNINLEDLNLLAGSREFPFWYIINGHLSDALTHVGQVVSFRRTSGNPIRKGVSVFEGIARE
ncbi:MAG: hypothetical protein KI791_07685 [Cyclobacteriaceae bacterium]|nr:hypothetical protein [Cyclobacteriaceae bacterium SS2]